METIIATTNRLKLREFTTADAKSLFDLNNDPEVIRFTGDVAFKNVFEAKSFIENYDQYTKFGYGRWTVIDKDSDAFLGWCGLKFDPETGETDLGFRFMKKYWNQGFATEAASASLQLGFERFGLSSIIGRAMQLNTASVKVLEKIGMVFESEFDFYKGHAGLIYRICPEDFK